LIPKNNERAPFTPFEAIQAGEGVTGTFRVWLQSLPFPPPVTLGIIAGAVCVALVGFWMFLGLFMCLSILVPTLNIWLMGRIGKWLKKYIEEVDREYIGVDIHIGKIDLSICYARVVIHHLKIDNPEGFHSDHLMYARSLTLDLDLLELLWTRGKHVVVEEFKLEELEAIIEYKNVVWGVGESNIQAVQDFMAGPPKDPEDGTGSSKATPRTNGDKNGAPNSDRSNKSQNVAEWEYPANTQVATVPEEKPLQAEEPEQPKKSAREYTLLKVEFVDIVARAAAKLGSGAAIHCADMRFKNFSEEFDSYTGADLMVCLVKTLTKSILASVLGGKKH